MEASVECFLLEIFPVVAVVHQYDFAAQMLETQAQRAALPGHAFPADTPWQHAFESTFPWQETADQEGAIRDVKADLESTRPMDRLICGDVGYGKTEVAMRAAFIAANDSKQVALLVPTTLLAQQHYEKVETYTVSWHLKFSL